MSNRDEVPCRYSLNTCCLILAVNIVKPPEFGFTPTQGVHFKIVSIDFTFLKLKLALDLLVLFTVVCRDVRVICLITMLDMGVIKIKLVPKKIQTRLNSKYHLFGRNSLHPFKPKIGFESD